MTETRTPEQIIADWLSGYNGDDNPARYESYARQLIGWLRDEGWVISALERSLPLKE